MICIEALSFDKWLRDYQVLADNSRLAYVHQVNKLMALNPGLFGLSDSEKVAHLTRFIASAPSCYLRKYAIAHWLRSLNRTELLEKLKPAFKMIRPQERKYSRLLDRGQIEDIIQAVSRDQNLKTILLIADDTALRIGGILSLKAENMHFDRDSGLYYLTAKTKRGKIVSKYVKPLTTANIKALGIGKGHLFIDSKGNRLTYYKAWSRLKTISRVCLGVGYGISFHWFRTSRAVALLKKYDLVSVSDMLDHCNLETTKRYVQQGGVKSLEIIRREVEEERR